MPVWQPTRIRWVDEPLDTSTGATRAETDAGAAYLKFLGNPEGPQALFCELVGTRAAAWLGLPTFEIGIIDVTEPDLVRYENGSSSLSGPAFAARFVEGTTWGGEAAELQQLENPSVLAGLIVADTWLLNCDRYRHDGGAERRKVRNVFLAAGSARGKSRVLAIDHTHIFTCGRELTAAIRNIDRVRSEVLHGHFPELKNLVRRPDVAAYAKKLQSFTPDDAKRLLAGIPRPWQPAQTVQEAVVDFLVRRAEFVSQNIVQMLTDSGYLTPELPLEE